MNYYALLYERLQKPHLPDGCIYCISTYMKAVSLALRENSFCGNV